MTYDEAIRYAERGYLVLRPSWKYRKWLVYSNKKFRLKSKNGQEPWKPSREDKAADDWYYDGGPQ